MSFTVHDAYIRRDICGDCRDGCDEHRTGQIDHADPCATCPRGIWHAWGDCAAVERPTAIVPMGEPSVGTRSSLRRVVRGWRRAGLRMVGRIERQERAAACEGCEFARRDPATGMPACGAGCHCGAAGASIYRTEARCKLGRWPARELQSAVKTG